MQADLIVNTMTPSHINFVNKKIKQEQIALSQIDEILSLVREKEREYQYLSALFLGFAYELQHTLSL